ncbi:FecR family protein [Pseudochelatococcus contaminans]|uniref:Transmembrane sensor n=1 Tax=Pseudochelatococcus contaminans TaxID=1538103 RepID=A0A7W5Z5A9_9HYPH|nr:FecR family protein [Pseudochelatococcus contaminans]MBB3810254.1 transmembrane sensor [Pseudochelatococcus contaminans]
MPDKSAIRARRKRHEEAAGWILRNREAERSAADEAAFQSWLNSDPENVRAYRAAELLMGEAGAAIASDPTLRDMAVKPRTVAKPAVAILLAAAVTGAMFIAADGPMRLRADAISGTGEMPVLTLADGSTVQLNASSAIAYDYSGNNRVVRLLRGQAYFEVAHDPTRPFSVDAGDTRITALGTAFDVRLGQTETDVTVTENAVLVTFKHTEKPPVRVAEGERLAYDPATGVSQVNPDDDLAAVAWQRGQLVVDNAPLSKIVEEINRHFSGHIVIAGKDVSQRRVSGTLAVSDTNAALVYLEQALQIKAQRIGPLIIIR